jgi:hypothetical protein
MRIAGLEAGARIAVLAGNCKVGPISESGSGRLRPLRSRGAPTTFAGQVEKIEKLEKFLPRAVDARPRISLSYKNG